MVSWFLATKGTLGTPGEFAEEGITINSKAYCETLKNQWRAIQNKL